MKERFLLNGVDMHRGGISVYQAIMFTVARNSDPTETAHSIFKHAASGAKLALNCRLIQLLIKHRLFRIDETHAAFFFGSLSRPF